MPLHALESISGKTTVTLPGNRPSPIILGILAREKRTVNGDIATMRRKPTGLGLAKACEHAFERLPGGARIAENVALTARWQLLNRTLQKKNIKKHGQPGVVNWRLFHLTFSCAPSALVRDGREFFFLDCFVGIIFHIFLFFFFILCFSFSTFV